MEILKQTRDSLGLSQSEMARLLGLKKSNIGLAETGDRKLPSHAGSILNLMAAFLKLDEGQPEPISPPSERLDKELKILKAKLAGLQLELENKQDKVSKIFRFKRICQQLEQNHATILTMPTLKWMDAMVSERSLQLEKSDDDPILLLKARIKGMEAMIDFLGG